MEHHGLGRAIVLEHADDVVVRVAVVNLQGDPVALGYVDVRFERMQLRRAAVLVGAEIVEARLADGANTVAGCEGCNALDVFVENPALVKFRCFVGVNGDSGQNTRIAVGEVGTVRGSG